MEEIQNKYYQKTASKYESMHVHKEDEHFTALKLIGMLAPAYGLKSFLDVGCGTGRGVEALLNIGLDAVGLDPSEELLAEAKKKNIPANRFFLGEGESLPFKDKSFDAVVEFAALHHVRHPNKVVSEMIRVARKAVFLSDSNRFGQGKKFVRFLKLALYKSGLWPLANFTKTFGKGYIITQGDGLSYSYSVYDSYNLLAKWTPQVYFLSTEKAQGISWLNPLLTSGHVLTVAIKES